MAQLSAFADEIGDDLSLQIEVLRNNGVGNIELRGVWGKNVLELSEDEIREVKKIAADNGIGFSAVGSPLGKFPLDGDFPEQLDGLKRALDYAQIIDAQYIRMFSFYIPEGDEPGKHRGQVLDWMGKMVEIAEETTVILAHENERRIYGDIGERCLDLYTSIQSPSFTGIFDFSNFVQCGDRPYDDCWVRLKQYISYFHVKDSVASTAEVVPAGEGDGDVRRILGEAFAAGFDGFLSLEPHLSQAKANYGKTSPDLFGVAADALKRILESLEIT